MERRFMIHEIEPSREDAVYKQYGITETELRRRVMEIIEADWSMDKCIEILLHGEPKKRDEWEEWVEQMPVFSDCYYDHWKDWFRRMPTRGK